MLDEAGSNVARGLAYSRRGLLTVAIAVFPVILARGFAYDYFNIPKLTFLLVVVSLALGLRLAEWLWTGRPVETRGYWIPAIALAVPLSLAWAFSSYKAWSLFGQYTRFAGLLPYLAALCLGLLIVDAFSGRPGWIAAWFLVGASGVGLVAILQMLFQGARVAVESDTSYVTSTLGHSNFTGGYLAIGLPIALTLWLRSTRRRASIAAAGATTLIVLGLGFTVSQGAWAAGAAGVAVVFGLLARDRIRIAPKLGAGVAVAIAALTVGVVVATIFVPHALEKAPGPLKTAVSRGFLWTTAIRVAADSPIVGAGPNVFAIEGPLQRPVEEALVLGFTKGDDPHSVPLGMLANAGLLGLAGYAIAVSWGLRIVRRRSQEVYAIAFGGALVAYVVQALVSVDEISLRFAFWVILAGLASVGQRALTDTPAVSSIARRFGAALIVAASVGTAAFAIRTVLIADRHMTLTMNAVARRDIPSAMREFRTASDLRTEVEYNRVYGGSIGDLGVILGPPEGRVGIEEMRRAFTFVRSFPDAPALGLEGWILLQWSRYDQTAAQDALVLLERSQELDPRNPQTGVLVADALIHLGEYERAIAELEPYARVLTEEFPEYSDTNSSLWANLAIANARAGRLPEASRAFARITRTGMCRPQIAATVLKGGRKPSPIADLVCPPILKEVITGTLDQSSDP
jgi:O-antigen ligase